MTSQALKKLIIDKLTELAAAGHSMKEAAAIIGAHYATVAKYARDYEIQFQKKYASKRSVSGRNAEIVRRYLAGEIHADLAKEYGITRERVRQICNRAGCVEPTKRLRDFMATVAGTVVRRKLSVSEAAELFGIERSTVYSYCRKFGVEPSRLTAEELFELELLTQAAAKQTSARQAAGEDRSLANKILYHLKKRGQKSKGRSRWDDFSERRKLFTKWRGEGKGWSEIAALLTRHDGKTIGAAAVQNWAHRHMPELFQGADWIAA